MILFFLVLLIINVGIGYLLAILYGMGPTDLRTLIQNLRLKLFREFSDLKILSWLKAIYRKAPNAFGNYLKFLPFPKFARNNIADVPIQATTEQKLQEISEIALDKLLDDEAEEITRSVPKPELFDDNLMNLMFNQSTEAWMASDKRIETSIQKLNLTMMKNGQFAAEIDAKLRAERGHADPQKIAGYCQTLAADCKNFIETQSEITREIYEKAREIGDMSRLSDEIDALNQELTLQIETFINNVDQLAQSPDANETAERLIAEIGTLRKARHRARDIQDRVFLAIAVHENRMDSINRPETFIDPTFGLNNRIAFQTNLWKWWRQERHKESKLTFALYDIVGFGAWNDKIGIEKCSRLFRTLGELIENSVENKDFFGIYAGNCFVSVSSNCGLRKTVAFVERIRQEIEQTRFLVGDDSQNENKTEEVALRLTCAVTEAAERQTENDLITVLEKTLQAAKNNGRNVTFVTDAARNMPIPEMVEAPDLDVSARIVKS
ncbi:MAG: GGDEF domain-containing protein [Planctomycetaceae bacterium]|nr:GGDEF domain-containing protein [Planctomycetaceae bacterium]